MYREKPERPATNVLPLPLQNNGDYMLLPKPKPAQGFVVTGLFFQFFGAVMFGIALPQTFGYYASGAAFFFVFVGAIVLLVGLILLLVGISRAVGGIDYLVAVAPTAGTGEAGSDTPISVPEAPVSTGASL